ncbi:MAG: DALR domain-containing protein, partial [Acidobacteriaceae bacterium]
IEAAAFVATGKFRAALANDLNTAEARAAIFDLVRFVNAHADAGRFVEANKPAVLETLRIFDQVFAVLDDHDAQWTRFTLDWAEREGRDASPEVLAMRDLTDAQIEALVAERVQAKKTRNFARADAIRNELAGKGILLEDSKDGVRWKRK